MAGHLDGVRELGARRLDKLVDGLGLKNDVTSVQLQDGRAMRHRLVGNEAGRHTANLGRADYLGLMYLPGRQRQNLLKEGRAISDDGRGSNLVVQAVPLE